MSQTQTPDDFFKLLKKYEERLDRLERANSTPQASPIAFQPEGNAADTRVRRTDAGVLIVERLDPFNGWTKTSFDGYKADEMVYPYTPWWSSEVIGGIPNGGVKTILNNSAGSQCALYLPVYSDFATEWEISMTVMVSADSGNWTKIYTGIQLMDPFYNLADQKISYRHSNKAATPNGDYDWQSITTHMRVSIPPTPYQYFVYPTAWVANQYGAVFHRNYAYSDFWARRTK
jgi:hypothetical protein